MILNYKLISKQNAYIFNNDQNTPSDVFVQI
jgi:hypothetical protein